MVNHGNETQVIVFVVSRSFCLSEAGYARRLNE